MQDFLLDENHNLSGMDADSVGQHLQVNYINCFSCYLFCSQLHYYLHSPLIIWLLLALKCDQWSTDMCGQYSLPVINTISSTLDALFHAFPESC